MSEAEKKQRLDYKQNRKKWIFIQLIAIAVVAALALASFVTYFQMSKTHYFEYTESGNIDYEVHLKENPFFEEESIGKDQAYISTLINNIAADFQYKLNMEEENVDFDYGYKIYAQLLVTDKDSGEALYDPVYELTPEKRYTQNSSAELKINETVNIDYVTYNDIAKSFTETYELKQASSNLVVTMQVNVVSKSESFENHSENTYSVSMLIPLVSNTVNIEVTSSVPSAESKILAVGSSIDEDIFKNIGIALLVLAILGAGGLIAFAYLTRNEDIRYESKVKRLVSNYRSFIQVITNEFDTEGYQVLMLSAFTEMLSIRDTIQSPILMHENEDKTCTHFFIPSNTKILYVYEIKVENFDEIYAEPAPEILEEVVDVETLEEALETPDVELEEIEFVDTVDEEDDNGVEVIGVVWPERAHKNKIYRYDPNGTVVSDGDIVLVPSRDVHRNKDIIRKAAVAHGNHKVPPETLKHPLKKIIGVVKRKAEQALTPDIQEEDNVKQ